jgi:DNA-directed RNA polymerase specialized sigma24 family protein
MKHDAVLAVQCPESPDAARGRALLEEHFDLIQQKLQHLSRRSGLPEHESEELRAWILFRLVEDEYRTFVKWEGRSSFSTYLTVVLVNLVRDYRVHVWGRWRPSAAARRRGAEAVLLEQLWLRDGLPLEQAIEQVQRERGSTLSRAELEQIAGELPERSERRQVGDEELHRLPFDGKVEARVETRDLARKAARVRKALVPAFQALPAEDRLLLKLHFRDGFTLSAIAALQRRPQRELYTARDRSLKKLRRALESAGLDREQVSDLIGSTLWDLPPGLVQESGVEGGIRDQRPSRRPSRWANKATGSSSPSPISAVIVAERQVSSPS